MRQLIDPFRMALLDALKGAPIQHRPGLRRLEFSPECQALTKARKTRRQRGMPASYSPAEEDRKRYHAARRNKAD